MKVKVNAKELHEALKTFAVLYKSCRKSDLSVLHHISLSVGVTGKLRLRMTDLEISLSVFLETEEAKPGFEAILPFKAFKDYVARKRGKITISEIPEGIRIGDALFTDLPSTKDYPSLPEIPSEMPYSVGGEEFADALSFSLPFICKEDANRFVLCGVCFEFPCKGEPPFRAEEITARLVATDGHRLSLTEVPFEGPDAKEQIQVILPKLAVEILLKIARQSKSLIRFTVIGKPGDDSFSVCFRGENWTLSVRPIDGQYPDYRAVFPEKGVRYVFDAEKMYEVLKEVEPVISLQENPYSRVKYKLIYMQPKRNKMEIFAKNGESATYTKKSIPLAPSEKPFTLPTIPFNISYLLDVLKGRIGKVVLTCLDQNRPAVFQFGNDPRKLALVMPMTSHEEQPQHEEPPEEVLQPLPSVQELERYHVEVRIRKTRKKSRSSRECATCKKLQEENELLQEQIEFLQAQLQKIHLELKGEETNAEAHATEAELLQERIAELEAENEKLLRALKETERLKRELDEIRARQERELQLVREELRALSEQRNKDHLEIPLHRLPEGGAIASVDGMVVYFRDGRILCPNGNGGGLVGRYDKLLGLGKIGDRVVHLKNNGDYWVLEILK